MRKSAPAIVAASLALAIATTHAQTTTSYDELAKSEAAELASATIRSVVMAGQKRDARSDLY